ncbi:MAG: CRISPR-associated protein Cas4 [Streptosporangiaceae bacterium]
MSPDASAQASYLPSLSQVPLSALEHFDYCPRQAGLILLEDGYADDAATIRGTLLHQRVHEPGQDTRAGLRTLRALPVWHEGLGLTGVCDVVEIRGDGTIIPVEHKSGGYHAGGPADVQLAAEAMCLEEMFSASITEGVIFSAADRRRHQVTIDAALRDRVASGAARVRAIMAQEQLPAPISGSRCRRCSMNHVCLPKVMTGKGTFARAADSLFTPAPESDHEWP